VNLTIYPGALLHGAVSLPGDKSLSHRAALLAALAEGESNVDNFLFSGVSAAMLDALTLMGVEWGMDGACLRVRGKGIPGLQPPTTPLNCGNSATTIRLLAGALAAAGIPAVLDGSAGLRRRPMQRIAAPLSQMGVKITTTAGCAPLYLVNHPPECPTTPCRCQRPGEILPAACRAVANYNHLTSLDLT
jgi:3-phosphoshikimate 1-carboxyvinyltransferase